MIYPFTYSNLWNNLIQAAFYTEEIISSAFDFNLSHILKRNDADNFSSLRNLILRLDANEIAPYSKKILSIVFLIPRFQAYFTKHRLD